MSVNPNNTSYQSIYGHKDTLKDAVEYIKSQLPITNVNDVHRLLGIYHNTLLKVLGDAECYQLTSRQLKK
jgi:hypothetical protein